MTEADCARRVDFPEPGGGRNDQRVMDSVGTVTEDRVQLGATADEETAALAAELSVSGSFGHHGIFASQSDSLRLDHARQRSVDVLAERVDISLRKTVLVPLR